MQPYYDLKPLCDQIHQEKLDEAERQRLARQMKTDHRPHRLQRLEAGWKGAPGLLISVAKGVAAQMIARARRGTA